MKKIIVFATAAVAFASMAASSDSAYAPPGKDNVSFGYGAGYLATGMNTNVVSIGTDAGMNSSNNRDCIFIGADAGKGVSGKTGAVIIGDGVLVHTNGVTTIKGLEAQSVGPFVATQIQHTASIQSQGGLISQNITAISSLQEDVGDLQTSTASMPTASDNGDTFTISFGNKTAISQGEFHAGSGFSVYKAWEPSETSGVVPIHMGLDYYVVMKTKQTIGATFRFDNGQFCVYTNNVKAGTLTFTPVP